MNDLNFYFHESFQPQLIYLSEILKLAIENFEGSKNEVSNITGIPTGESSGKIMPNIKYLNYMGLINYEEVNKVLKLKATELGNIIYNNDPYMMEKITKIIMHYNLTRLNKGAPQWSFLFRSYEYNFNENLMIKNIINNGELKFGKDIKIGPLKTLYTKGDFKEISLFDIDGENILFKEVYPSYECNNAYGYLLLKEWEEVITNSDEITINELLNDIKWNRGLGFDYDTTIEILDELMIRGVIKLNKQFNPITIIKNTDSKNIINCLYDDLI